MRYWYMRDNHSFRELPAEADRALVIIAEEVAAGFANGLLCCSSDSDGPSLYGAADWLRFESSARQWFATQQQEQPHE